MRLLLIEDDVLLLDFLSKELRADGHAVDTAGSGAEGLSKALLRRGSGAELPLWMGGDASWGGQSGGKPHALHDAGASLVRRRKRRSAHDEHVSAPLGGAPRDKPSSLQTTCRNLITHS